MEERTKLREPIVYEIEDADPYENVFDSKGDAILAMRNVSWNNAPSKLELRRWRVSEGEKDEPRKGFAFLTEEGPDNLAEMLVRNGYGDTNTLLDYIEDREKDSSEALRSGMGLEEFKALVSK